EGERRLDCAGPGAKVLGRHLAPRCFAKICVHIGGGDALRLSLLVEILKQILARKLLTGADHLCDAAVLNAQLPGLATLALEQKAQLATRDVDVAVAQGGEAEAAVLFGVVLVADAD